MSHAIDCYLLHGWGFKNTVFNGLKSLLPENWNVLTPCFYQMAEDTGDGCLDALAEKLMLELNRDAVLVGWSMGGLVAQLAAAKSQHVKLLVLIASAPCFVNTDGWHHTIDKQAFAELMDDFATDANQALNRFVGLVAQGEQRQKQMIITLKQYCALPEQAGVLATWLKEIQKYDLRHLYSMLNIPVLLLFGERDALIGEKAADEMINKRAQRLTLKGCGHAPIISRTEGVAGALQEFRGSHG